MDLNWDEIELHDLPKKHQEYAKIIGVKNLLALSKEFGGTDIYIPQIDKLIKYKKYRLILKEFDGSNVKELVKKYGVSQCTVYGILGNHLKNKVMKGQISMFDILGDAQEEDK